jgi:hypothetical protein
LLPLENYRAFGVANTKANVPVAIHSHRTRGIVMPGDVVHSTTQVALASPVWFRRRVLSITIIAVASVAIIAVLLATF